MNEENRESVRIDASPRGSSGSVAQEVHKAEAAVSGNARREQPTIGAASRFEPIFVATCDCTGGRPVAQPVGFIHS
jgi:hypothetical protein